MRRYSYIAVVLMGLGLLSYIGGAQVETLQGLVLEDLQLISQESLPNWTPAWTGPIQGATIAAWFAEHGYPALMHDFNGDGIVDELDTIELANDFGLGLMQTGTPRGTTDVRLVVGLATYVAGSYPDQFVLKIYDLGFPTEFAAQGYGTFTPDVIPGIILELKEEPSIEAYIYELSTEEGVIVGLEEGEVDRNRYLAGRSFLSEATYEGYTPLDFAWAQEDRWKPGHQGQVLETVGKMENLFYLDFQGNWTVVEFMLALSPIEEGAEGPPDDTTDGCPDLTIYVLDESCVYDPRAQAYNITVWAEVTNVGTQPVTEPFLVVLNSTTHPGGAVQLIPVPPVLNPGDSIPVTLSFSTPPDPSGAAPCPLTYVIEVDARDDIDECDEDNNTAWGEVCCDSRSLGACCLPDGTCAELTAPECEARKGIEFHPGVDCSVVQCPPTQGACPDLVGDITNTYCNCITSEEEVERTLVGYDPKTRQPIYEDVVVSLASTTCEARITVTVTNIGSAAAGPSHVSVTDLAHGVSGTAYIHDLSAMQSATVWVNLSFHLDVGSCNGYESMDLELIVDSSDEVDECDEENSFQGSESCYCL